MKVCFIFLFSFYIIASSKAQPCSYSGGTVDYLNDIKCTNDFAALQARPLKSTFANVQSVKIIYEIGSGALYYTNSTKYQFHFSFISQYLGTYEELEDFNKIEYGNSSKRLYGIANINYYKASDTYTLELFPDDEIDEPTVVKMYNKVVSTSFFGTKIKLLNQGWNTNKLAQKGNIPTIAIEDIYKQQQYQGLIYGAAVGRLKFIENNKAIATIQPNDIVILNHLPNNLPLCKAVVTSVFQTPLCHINVLAQNRNMPNAVLRNIFANKALQKLENDWVQITVNDDSIIIVKATYDEIANSYLAKPNKRKLPIDIKETNLLSGKKLSLKKISAVGGKAANMGELAKIKLAGGKRLPLPDHVFAIPFYYYIQHIKSNNIEPLIDSLLTNQPQWQDRIWLQSKLTAIQSAIQRGDIDPSLIDIIRKQIGADSTHNFRYRSSTNAEDVQGFNGAGLYDSKTGNLTDTKRPVDKAIKTVWASVWNIRAFEERALFGIDQANLAMGILVNKAFGAEEANGVAVTKNLYRRDYPAYTVNVQIGENIVVQPDSGVLTEQFLILDAGAVKQTNKVAVDYICKSSLTNGAEVMTETEIKELAQYLTAIKKHYWKKVGRNLIKRNRHVDYNLLNAIAISPSYNDFGMDIEFKLEKDTRAVVIKQARVY